MNACIFCLEIGDTFNLTGPCDCRPTVDMKCLQEWQKSKADTCPICLVSYIVIDQGRIGNVIIRQPTDNRCVYCVLCCMGCVGVLLFTISACIYMVISK